MSKNESDKVIEIPAILLNDVVVLPQMAVPIEAEDARTQSAVQAATSANGQVALLFGLPEREDQPLSERFHPVGVIAELQTIRRTEGSVLIAQGISRAKIQNVLQTEPHFSVACEPSPDPETWDEETEALRLEVMALIETFIELMPGMPEGITNFVRSIRTPGHLADNSAYAPEYTYEQRLALLETFDVKERLLLVRDFFRKRVAFAQVQSQIREQAKAGVEQSQREFILREQLKAIRKELGESDETEVEIEEYRRKIEAAGMTGEARKEALRELSRLEKMQPQAAEYSVIKTYLEWLTELPWDKLTEDNLDLERARQVLDEDHYDLEEVKERIVEYLAVRKLALDRGLTSAAAEERRGAILCFVGPPGVGKTSLGRSIARALGREFTRMSLGGMRDEAGADWRGDPSSALLEVLDPEQNSHFRDHYLDVDFDLSQVMFITTANLLEPIPAPLRDRMEIIRLDGYVEPEKVQIARHYLIPRQLRANSLQEATDDSAGEIEFTDEALQTIIRDYTREAGVRQLEREIGRAARKIATQIALGEEQGQIVLDANQISDLLGKPRFFFEAAERTETPGVATGLAVTETGGDILFIEATRMAGKGQLTLTGHLGEVMKESASLALSYVRSRASDFGLDEDLFEKSDIHVHVPAGAVPKDGPSAGVAIVTAIVSLLTGIPAASDVAMTGEITLRGSVLPIGGVKQKALAAHRAGLKKVILPMRNEPDLDELPEEVRQAMTFVLAEKIDDALFSALPGLETVEGVLIPQTAAETHNSPGPNGNKKPR
ncbi:MAG: LON peptidase substrate-binding domain-containing protein [Anaerolineales bacterium]